MTTEQRKAIENLSEIVNLSKEELQKENENITAILDYEDLKSLDTVLSLIKEQEKQIDLMADKLVEAHEWFYSEFDNFTKEDFIKYFADKAKMSQ